MMAFYSMNRVFYIPNLSFASDKVLSSFFQYALRLLGVAIGVALSSFIGKHCCNSRYLVSIVNDN